MPHIKLQHLPGIISLFQFSPETAKPLSELTEVLLRAKSSLTCGERELIAVFVSAKNDCYFCTKSHSAIATNLLDDSQITDLVIKDYKSAPISEKLKSLLTIAGKIQEGGKKVIYKDIEIARENGATDIEIHDTVLISAAFCMYNRYVDGLNSWAPAEEFIYEKMGKEIAENGYLKV